VPYQGTGIAMCSTLKIKQPILNIPCSGLTEYGQRFKIYRNFWWGIIVCVYVVDVVAVS